MAELWLKVPVYISNKPSYLSLLAGNVPLNNSLMFALYPFIIRLTSTSMIIYDGTSSFHIQSYREREFEQRSMFIHVSITFLILIFRTFWTSNIQTRWYLMIVRTADKPGYTLFPQRTMEVFTGQTWIFNWRGWREGCVGYGSFLKMCPLSFKFLYFLNQNACTGVSQVPKRVANSRFCLELLIVHWTKPPRLCQPQIQQHRTKYLWYSSIVNTHLSSPYIDH